MGAGTMLKLRDINWVAPMALAGVVAVAGGCATAEESDVLTGTEVYRIQEVYLPTSFEEVRQMAFDLDVNGTPDNAAGATLMSLFNTFDEAAETLPTLINDALVNDTAAWTLTVERDPETGIIDSVSLGDERKLGYLADSAPATLFSDLIGDWPVTWSEVHGAVGDFGVIAEDDGALYGRLGFAMPQATLRTLAEPMARFFTEQLEAGRLGETNSMMDQNEDGVITTDELLDFELVRTLLMPDVDLIAADGTKDCWSVGIRVRAWPAGHSPIDTPVD